MGFGILGDAELTESTDGRIEDSNAQSLDLDRLMCGVDGSKQEDGRCA